MHMKKLAKTLESLISHFEYKTMSLDRFIFIFIIYLHLVCKTYLHMLKKQ